MSDSVSCVFCGRVVPVETVGEHLVDDIYLVPQVEDDAAWRKAALHHAPDCEWIATRGRQMTH